MTNRDTIIMHALSWLERNAAGRSTLEREAYLNALQDAGVLQATVDAVENGFERYNEAKEVMRTRPAHNAPYAAS